MNKKRLKPYECPRQEVVAFSAASGLLQGSFIGDQTTITDLEDPEDLDD